jgi:AcrR family transcriptional regulator
MPLPITADPTASGARTLADTPRERILRTAYDLFCREGLHAVGVDRIVAEAGVAKMSLYRHFHSKDELVLAVLQRRKQLWTDWLMQEVERRASTPQARLLAIFDVLHDWFRRKDYEGCLFANSLLETHDRRSPVGAACVTQLATVRAFVRGLTEETGITDPDGFARQWQILMLGSIVAAATGDTQAAKRAQRIATHLLHEQRQSR